MNERDAIEEENEQLRAEIARLTAEKAESIAARVEEIRETEAALARCTQDRDDLQSRLTGWENTGPEFGPVE
jgi:hypothetical protein